MYFEENISLKPYNTFGIDNSARWFARFDTINLLAEQLAYIQQKNKSILILGGGSNILLCNDFDGLVIKNNIVGFELINEDKTHVWLKANSGTIWHDLVLHCVSNNWYGIENLSLIPFDAFCNLRSKLSLTSS
mgnify:CR=1 FL=1